MRHQILTLVVTSATLVVTSATLVVTSAKLVLFVSVLFTNALLLQSEQPQEAECQWTAGERIVSLALLAILLKKRDRKQVRRPRRNIPEIETLKKHIRDCQGVPSSKEAAD